MGPQRIAEMTKSEMMKKAHRMARFSMLRGDCYAVNFSDLQRAYKSAEIGFGNKWPIIQDARLRECNYGDLTQHPSSEVDVEKPKRIQIPFPNGESYEQTTARMKSFLEDLLKNYNAKRVMIIGHRATQYGLDHLIDGIPLEQLTSSHFKWQPGWEYDLEKLNAEIGHG
jgi:broad specificity phosphatase PhoE